MTAQSEILSGKRLRAFVKRGQQPLRPRVDPEVYLFLARRTVQSRFIPRLDQKLAKRLFDVVFSLILILFSGLPVLSLADCLKLAWSCFYIQERVGKNHKTFGCIKFRTMVTNADEILNWWKRRLSYGKNLRIIALKQDPELLKLVNFCTSLTRISSFGMFCEVTWVLVPAFSNRELPWLPYWQDFDHYRNYRAMAVWHDIPTIVGFK